MGGFTRNEMAILVVTALGHAVCHLGELLFPAVMVAVMREFDLPPDQATLLVLLGYVLMGAGALPVGLWADAGDPWHIHLIFFAAMAVGCASVALAGSPLALFAALTVLGMATSIYHPTGLAMLSVGVRRSNFAMGINGVAGSIGIAMAPLLGERAHAWGDWRLAYWVVCGFAIVSGMLMFGGWKYRFRMPARTTDNAPGAESAEKRPFPWLLIAVMFMGGVNYRCLVTTLPPLLTGRAGEEFGGVAASLILLAGCAGQLLSGRLGDVFGCRRIYLTLVCTMIPLALTIGTLTGAWPTLLLASVYSMCLFGQQPVENTLLAEATPIRRRSLSYGIKFILTFGLGALGTQVVGEYWKWAGSLDGMFYILAGSSSVMGTMLSVWCYRHARRPAAVAIEPTIESERVEMASNPT